MTDSRPLISMPEKILKVFKKTIALYCHFYMALYCIVLYSDPEYIVFFYRVFYDCIFWSRGDISFQKVFFSDAVDVALSNKIK